MFVIERDENNKGIISLQKRLDREMAGLYTLTIKCFEPSDKSVKNERKKYENMVSRDSLETKTLNISIIQFVSRNWRRSK